MAHCYPREVPQSILQDPSREAEVKVFRALASLPDSFRRRKLRDAETAIDGSIWTWRG